MIAGVLYLVSAILFGVSAAVGRSLPLAAFAVFVLAVGWPAVAAL